MKSLAAFALALFALGGTALAQAPLSPTDLLAHGATYDGKSVTVAGTVARVDHHTSRKGNQYTLFDLCAGSSCIRVFEFGSPSFTEGQTTTVTGTFAVEKHVGSAVYHNELDVDNQ